MTQETIQNAIEGALVADAYALGAHWIYDVSQLEDLDIDWESLNDPQAMWHKGKGKGDFTHYGDQASWLLKYIKNNKHFDINTYGGLWLDNMQEYTGYVDASSRETMDILEKDPKQNTGSHSHDLSIIGRIAPLLLVSDSKDEFLDHVDTFVRFTHDDETVRKAARFFGGVLYDVAEGKTIAASLSAQELDQDLEVAFAKAIMSRCCTDTLQAIRDFGPACGVEGGFEGTVHLLARYEEYKEAMIQNAKAGGDSAARGMIVGMIMGAAGFEIPSSWKENTKGL